MAQQTTTDETFRCGQCACVMTYDHDRDGDAVFSCENGHEHWEGASYAR